MIANSDKTAEPVSLPRSVFNGARVDWRLRDREIAEQLGVTKSRVQQVRHLLGKPPSEFITLQTQRLLRRDRLFIQMHAEGLCAAEISSRAGASINAVRARMKALGLKHNPPPKRPTHAEVFDWNLCNVDLNRIWRQSNVATIRPRPAMFDYHDDRKAFRSRMLDPIYRTIYAAEKKRAARHFARRHG